VILVIGIFVFLYKPDLIVLATTLVVISGFGYIWVTLRKLIRYCIFPGSFWPFRRTIELNYSFEMSGQIFKKLKSLNSYLKNIEISENDSQDSYINNSKKLINTLIRNFQNLSNKSKNQLITLRLLMNLKFYLERIMIRSGSTDFNLWTWIEIRLEISDPTCSVLKTDENLENLKKAKFELKKLLKILGKSSTRQNCFIRFFSYFTEYNLGTLGYMRSDLMKRFRCKQNEINGVDTMFVKTEDKSLNAVLLCSPNAGFYEFTYFQSDWLEFYLSRDINVILWNYRGYGLSKGSPFIRDLVKDGVCILKYYKEKYSLNKIILHGESIGGCIAIQICKHLQVDFLLADRTFGNLSDVVRFNYGIFSYYLFKLLRIPDINNTEIFLKFPNHKLITFDPHDSIIADYISLKSAVASSFILKSPVIPGLSFYKNHWKKLDYILTSKQFSDFSSSLQNFKKKFSLYEKDNEKFKNFVKTEDPEEVLKKDLPRTLEGILCSIDSCGVSLDQVAEKNKFFLYLWVMSLEVWGSFKDSEEIFSRAKIMNELNDLLHEVKLVNDEELAKNCRVIIESLLKILPLFWESSRLSLSHRTEPVFGSEVLPKVGYLQIVRCGHGGQFTHSDRLKYETHLMNSALIP
jgi:hypothetical protein